ncbi:Uncharacterised protein [Campylobacter hyointestinalis subsp. hyointestinalis]|uniref:Uncharacterized protein n=1 Tax=Campylobacter hyointestinalis subsp. hyointestinalis TaxID=91352 RepID=A0A9W5ANV4_CAMHY|nr:Uncharacterised protein [Campylobacter hyointestinalis subsp. hyointestinalis]CUU82032.1 Uncharacterised protein [Campylobacter hyointestinalis subsp. hyointestinalis]
MQDENLIKQTCKELNLTYKQLGEMIGLDKLDNLSLKA